MAIPKLALIPSGVADDKVFSVLPSNGDGDFDFDRGSTATRVNAQGLIETVSNDLPRLNYSLLDGKVVGCPSLLLENSATNVFSYSEAFDNAYWTKQDAVITSNQAISPDGTLNADLYTTSSDVYDFVRRPINFTSGQTYTLSIFVKSGTSNEVRLDLPSAFTDRSVVFNLDNKTYTAVSGSPIAKIEDYGNGWLRCSITATATSTSSGTTGFSSTKPIAVSTLYLWGAMVEQNSHPTSYIPTTIQATTRLAETCNGAGTSDTFNDSEGVLMFEMSALANDSYRLISLSDGTNGNNVRINLTTTANQIIFEANSDNSLQSAFTYNGVDVLLNNKIIIKYKQNDYSFWVNGFKVGTDTSGNTPIGLDRINFDRGTGGNVFYGKNKQLQYFDTTLTDSELEQLTSWVSFQEMAEGQLYTIE